MIKISKLVSILIVSQNMVLGIDPFDIYQIFYKNSYSIKIQNENLNEKEGVLDYADGYFDWNALSSLTSGMQYRLPTIDEQEFTSSALDDLQIRDDSFSFGLNKQFKFGSSLSPSIIMKKAISNLPLVNDAYDLNLQLLFKQPLTRAKRSYAKSMYESSKLDFKSEKSRTKYIFSNQLYYVLSAYFDYVFSVLNHKIYLRSEHKSKQFYKETLELIKADIRPESDINQLEADLLEKKISLIESEQIVKEYKSVLCKFLSINFNIFDNYDSEFEVLDSIFYEKELPTIPKENLIRIALKNRNDIKSASLNIKSTDILQQSAKSYLLPDIYLQALYNINGFDVGSSFNDVLSNSDTHITDFGLSLNLNYSFSNKFARGQYKQAKAIKNKAKYYYDNKKMNIELDVITAIDNFNSSRKALEHVIKSYYKYQNVLENEKYKFKEGRTTLVELLILQDKLIMAELNLSVFKCEYLKSIIRLKHDMGLLTPMKEFSREDLNDHFISTKDFFTLTEVSR